MSKLYKKLQVALTSIEEGPAEIITKQTLGEGLYIIRGKDQGCAAWHYILVPHNKVADLKAQVTGVTIDITKFGHIIEYRDRQGKIKPMSGWGTDPPKTIETWIEERYNTDHFDGITNWTYEKDDIRLCIMQRAIPKQRIGVTNYYHRQEKFHYIRLTEELESSLARRVGIKDYDVVISFNGVSIEYDTHDQFMRRWDAERYLPVQMLVCSPVTYQHYRANNKIIHSDLSTVQHLKPVYDTSISDSNTDTSVVFVDEHSFCAVQWNNNDIVSTVPQSAVFKSPEYTRVNDICFVEIEGQYQKGKIIFIGSYSDCEKSKKVIMMQTYGNPANSISGFTNLKSLSLTDTVDVPTRLEQLPNELFFYLFTSLDAQHLCNAFWGLNSRLNNLFQSCQNLSLTLMENTDQEMIKLYALRVVRLVINTPKRCNFSQLPNLQRLIVGDRNSEHVKHIKPDILPNLTHLSFLFGTRCIAPSNLVNNIFSNKFLSLRQVSLGRINESTTCLWSISPSLRFVAIHCNNPQIVEDILITCPNLDHLQLHILGNDQKNVITVPLINYSLRRLTLWSHSMELSLDNINAYLRYTPDIQHLYLQTECKMPFIYLANGLIHTLQHLLRFDCYIKEVMRSDERMDKLSPIHQLHPCFDQIKRIEEDDDYRIFATD